MANLWSVTMISFKKGDLLKSDCDVICHQVNLQGVMGGGLAFQIATTYPKVEKTYKYVAEHYKNLGGKVHFSCVAENGKRVVIANCFSQNKDFTTNYSWLRKVCERVRKFCELNNFKSVGIPKNYGCGIAHGDWKIVSGIWASAFEDSPINLEIWEI